MKPKHFDHLLDMRNQSWITVTVFEDLKVKTIANLLYYLTFKIRKCELVDDNSWQKRPNHLRKCDLTFSLLSFHNKIYFCVVS